MKNETLKSNQDNLNEVLAVVNDNFDPEDSRKVNIFVDFYSNLIINIKSNMQLTKDYFPNTFFLDIIKSIELFITKQNESVKLKLVRFGIFLIKQLQKKQIEYQLTAIQITKYLLQFRLLLNQHQLIQLFKTIFNCFKKLSPIFNYTSDQDIISISL